MPTAMSEKDKCFCEWLHDAIPNRAPVVLTLFNNDSFERDSYLELRYCAGDPIAHLFFCGNGISKLRNDAFFGSSTQNCSAFPSADTQAMLNSLNPFSYLHHARICGEKLSYLVRILCACQNLLLNQSTFPHRDGNIVTLKGFWPSEFEATYWTSPQDFNTRIEELVWILADFLPLPAREALQPVLPAETVRKLRAL